MTIDDIYKSIADNIVTNVPESWIKAQIIAERASNNALSLEGGYEDENDAFTSFKFRNFDRRIFNDFHVLHQITTKGGNNRWNRATFSLSNDGKFTIDFQWDQALADEVESNS